MLNIEFLTRQETGNGETSEYVRVNGLDDFNSWSLGEPSTWFHFHDKDVIAEILKYSFKDVGKFLASVHLEVEYKIPDHYILTAIHCAPEVEHPSPYIQLELRPDFDNWKKPWSMSEFKDEFNKIVENLQNPDVEYYQEDRPIGASGFGIIITFDSFNSNIGEAFDYSHSILLDVVNQTLYNLEHNIDSILLSYNFPSHLKIPAKQYLLYFAQFLADIGIEATTDVREKAGEVLFTISPVEGVQALDKIREALNVYLQAPNSLGFDAEIGYNHDMAALQLQAQVHFLKSQYMLALATVQNQQETIAALQFSKYQENPIVLAQVMPSEIEKKEELINGILSVGKMEWYGVEVNWGEMVRKLKRRFL